METDSKSCATCHAVQGPGEKPLKKCGRCKKTWYCSRECQINDWPNHKAVCAPGENKPKVIYPEFKDFFRTEDEKTTYEHLIDCFRLRCDDDYVWGGHYHGIYEQSAPLPYFKDFLNRAEENGSLPCWWNEAKKTECIDKAMRDEWANINYAVVKPDIQERYKDNWMPMKLRMVAENVYGGGRGLGQHPLPNSLKCLCGQE